MNIRTAVPEDLSFIFAGIKETQRVEKRSENLLVLEQESKSAVSSIEKSEIWIAERAGEKAGFIWVKTDFHAMHMNSDNYLWVNLIYVREKFRQKGVGRLLHEEAVRIAKDLDKSELALDIFDVNEVSKLFYSPYCLQQVYTIYTVSF